MVDAAGGERVTSLDYDCPTEDDLAAIPALATVPLGAADKLLGRTEVDQFCSVEEQTTRKRTVERIVGGGE